MLDVVKTFSILSLQHSKHRKERGECVCVWGGEKERERRGEREGGISKLGIHSTN